jgi:hypothetical protein
LVAPPAARSRQLSVFAVEKTKSINWLDATDLIKEYFFQYCLGRAQRNFVFDPNYWGWPGARVR